MSEAERASFRWLDSVGQARPSKLSTQELREDCEDREECLEVRKESRPTRLDSTDRLLLEEDPEKHTFAPFLSNSDGAKYVKEQTLFSAARSTLRDRRQSQVGPIFLGGHFLHNSEIKQTPQHEVGCAYEASNPGEATSFAASQYLLFPPLAHGTEAAQAATLSESGAMKKSASFATLNEATATGSERESQASKCEQWPGRLNRRRSFSTQSGNLERLAYDCFRFSGRETGTARSKPLKRATVGFPLQHASVNHLKSSSVTTSNTRRTIQPCLQTRASSHAMQSGYPLRARFVSQIDDHRWIASEAFSLLSKHGNSAARIRTKRLCPPRNKFSKEFTGALYKFSSVTK